MIISSLQLRSFRSHENTTLEFAPKVNLIYGPNGVGKTNILEAVHYLGLSKNFLPAKDRLALRKGASFFEIKGKFSGERRTAMEVRLLYEPRRGKNIFTNGAPIERLADFVGTVPVVCFAPGDIIVTAGPPAERRRLLNNILCQARPVYFEQLMRYRRVLRQRNELLMSARQRKQKVDAVMMGSWNELLAAHGSKIIAMRKQFVRDFAAFLQKAFRHLSQIDEKPAVAYRGISTLPPGASEDTIRQVFKQELRNKQDAEFAMGRTMVGPHLDDLRFSIDELLMRDYASQGQHRTVGIALKLAQYYYLQDRLEEQPLLLLDDVFDSLDEQRMKAFLTLLQGESLGQTLITAAGKSAIARFVPFGDVSHRQIEIQGRYREKE